MFAHGCTGHSHCGGLPHSGLRPKGVSDQALATDIQAKLYPNDATRAANVKVTG